MTTDILSPSEVIDLMVDLRLQLTELENQINALKPSFFAACAEQNSLQFEHERALISRKLTPGRWNYPDPICNQERLLKQLKLEFRQTHEPHSGREVVWIVKLLPDQS